MPTSLRTSDLPLMKKINIKTLKQYEQQKIK